MELVTLKSSTSKRLSPPYEFPRDWIGTTGVQLDSEHVMVCGSKKRGSVDMDADCFRLQKNSFNNETFLKNTGEIFLNHSRAHTASVLTKHGWWITGGEVEVSQLQPERSPVSIVSSRSTEL